MIRVTVIAADPCPHCRVPIEKSWSWECSRPETAARRVGKRWEGPTPLRFRIERWSRGEEPRLLIAGPFTGWQDLQEIAREIGRGGSIS